MRKALTALKPPPTCPRPSECHRSRSPRRKLSSPSIRVATDDAPLLVFHQCMDKEWASWGRDSAREFAKQGFAVIRVKSCPWKDLKATSSEAFRNPYKKEQTEQQMICTIVMRDITCPMVQNVVQRMQSGALPSDLRTWNPIRSHFGSSPFGSRHFGSCYSTQSSFASRTGRAYIILSQRSLSPSAADGRQKTQETSL